MADTFILPTLQPGERIEINYQQGELQWFVWSPNGIKVGYGKNYEKAIANLTNAILRLRRPTLGSDKDGSHITS